MWYVQVCLAVVHLTIAHALLQKHSYLWFRNIISLVFFHMVRAGAYWHKIHTKQSAIAFGFVRLSVKTREKSKFCSRTVQSNLDYPDLDYPDFSIIRTFSLVSIWL